MDSPDAIVQRKETRTQRGWLRGDGIVVLQIIAGQHQRPADADENVAVYVELSAGKVAPLLVDMRQPFGTDTGVRDRYARFEHPNLVAIGLLIASGFGRVFGNLFLTFHRQRVPVRIFNDEAAAIAWLQKFAPHR